MFKKAPYNINFTTSLLINKFHLSAIFLILLLSGCGSGIEISDYDNDLLLDSFNQEITPGYNGPTQVASGTILTKGSYTIISTPPLFTNADETFNYSVQTQEILDPATIQFKVIGPASMTINNSGILTWTPVSEDANYEHTVIISVSDRAGSAMQQFSLKVHSGVSSDVPVSCDASEGIVPLTINCNYSGDNKAEISSFSWDLGNGEILTEENATYTYTSSGEYKVKLTITTQNNSKATSSEITIKVAAISSIQFNTSLFNTINAVNDLFSIGAKVKDSEGNLIPFKMQCDLEQNPVLLKQADLTDNFIALDGGFANIQIKCGEYDYKAYYFVSPTPSKHNTRDDVNWYKTQLNTGTYSNVNCGPTSSAMAIMWATGKDVSVASIRNDMGHGGYTNMTENIAAIKKNGVNAYFTETSGPNDIIKIIDKGNLAMPVFNTGHISTADGDYTKDLFGKYYSTIADHFIIIKGYSLDKKYFIVYDPIPSDWSTNKARYADGVTMLGANRYYAVSEVYSGMTQTKSVIEIER